MTIKKAAPIVGNVPEKAYHYFGSTCFNWCRADSVEAVLKNLASWAGADTVKRQIKNNGGLYAWVCRVEVPQSSSYGTNFFRPVDVPVSESWEFNIMNTKGHVLPITREDKPDVQLAD